MCIFFSSRSLHTSFTLVTWGQTCAFPIYPDVDIEVVAGVRRFWTVRWLRDQHHPEYDYLVTIQSVTDEASFPVSDVENRSRKDITDWERGIEYSRALAEFYNGSQNEMAEHLKISRSWLSRLLDVVRLP